MTTATAPPKTNFRFSKLKSFFTFIPPENSFYTKYANQSNKGIRYNLQA